MEDNKKYKVVDYGYGRYVCRDDNDVLDELNIEYRISDIITPDKLIIELYQFIFLDTEFNAKLLKEMKIKYSDIEISNKSKIIRDLEKKLAANTEKLIKYEVYFKKNRIEFPKRKNEFKFQMVVNKKID